LSYIQRDEKYHSSEVFSLGVATIGTNDNKVLRSDDTFPQNPAVISREKTARRDGKSPENVVFSFGDFSLWLK